MRSTKSSSSDNHESSKSAASESKNNNTANKPLSVVANPLWSQLALDTERSSRFIQRKCTQCNDESIQAKSPNRTQIGDANDHYEQEADRIADIVTSGATVKSGLTITPVKVHAVQTLCDKCEKETVQTKSKNSKSTTSNQASTSDVNDAINHSTSSEPLPSEVRGRIEKVLDVDLAEVRVHQNVQSERANRAIHSRAFANQNNIYLRQNESAKDISLMAHEVTHTLQQRAAHGVIQRRPNNTESTDIEEQQTIVEIQAALVQALTSSNMIEVAHLLENKTTIQLQSMRAAAQEAGFALETWLARRRRWRNAEQALRNLWPALGMVDRMQIYDQGFREIEQAQIDVIRSFSQTQRLLEQDDPRLTTILASMSPTEEFEARILINPEQRYQATEQLLVRAPGILSDEEDPVFKAFAELPRAERHRFYNAYLFELSRLLDVVQLRLVHTMADGTEAQALTAQLRLATEYRIDDGEGVTAVASRMGSLLTEHRSLTAQLQDPELSDQDSRAIRRRLDVIGNVERLLEFERSGMELQSGSMMNRLSDAASSPEQFASWTAAFESGLGGDALRQFRFESAKQQIILAGADYELIETILLSLQAPLSTDGNVADLSAEQRQAAQHRANNELRQDLLDDPQISNVLGDFWGPGGHIDRDKLLGMGSISQFDAVFRGEFITAVQHDKWGEAFEIALRISKNSDWRSRFQPQAIQMTVAGYSGEPRAIIEYIIQHRSVPLGRILRFTGDLDSLRPIVGQIDEPRRARLRLGYWISRQQTDVESRSEEQARAFAEFTRFKRDVLASQTTANTFIDQSGIQDIFDLVLGNAPTSTELSSGTGRQRAADIMFHRHQERNQLDRGMATGFSETDETMDAANREFIVLYNMLSEQGTMSATDFARLAALHQRFESRTDEFEQASNKISEMASVVVSTVAATLVVLATGGSAAPAVIAAAAAAGGGSRVLAREMFGGDYYDPASAEGGRDLLLGAIDGALAVVGSAVAAKGMQMMGLGGNALTSAAARAGAEAADLAAEQMTASLGRRVVLGGVEAAIDGAFSNTITESATAFTDPQTWRRGVWQGIVKVGQAAVIGGLTGIGSGVITGGALPIGGAAASRLWTTVAGDSVERIVADAGPRARELLAQTRESIAQENFDQARRLLGQLEEQLSPQQARSLREAIGMDGRMLAEGHSLADSLTARQRELLEQSGSEQDGADLTQEMLDNELDLVRRSRAQPTDEPGYIDEVELGNNHSWKRKEDGTWCRFSNTSLCGTRITGGPAPANASDTGSALWDDLSRQLGNGTTDQITPQFATAATKTEAPAGFEPQHFDSIHDLPQDTTGNYNGLQVGVVYEIGGQHRIWREGDMVYHDSVIGGSSQRAGAEGDFYTAGEMDIDAVTGMHRGHVLGQGTGFESPFHISYIPREVNLHLQNDGVEELMRGLNSTARPGETFHVATATRRHSGTTRLSEISYRIEVSVDGGARTQLFEYRITIGNDVPNPSIQHGFVGGTLNSDAAGRYLNRFDVGDRVRTRRSRWRTNSQNGTGHVRQANNWADVTDPNVSGRNPQDVLSEGTLNQHYTIFQRDDGLWRIQRRAGMRNDTLYQRLTVVADNRGNQTVQVWRPN